jgi:hypothetical protein
VIQDLSLEVLQSGTGFDPELVDEERACVLEDLQSVRLPSRAVQREHELGAQPLAERMVGDQALEPGNNLRVSAELQVCLDLLFDHRQPELFESHSLRGRKLLIAKVGQGLTAEKGECLPELLRPSRRTVRSRDGDDSLEAPAVQLVLVRQKQPVARRSCLDPLGSEPFAQRRDVTLKGRLSSLRRAPPPHPV